MCLHQALFIPLAGSGSQWSEEAIEAFESLSHTAEWKVLMASTAYYRRDDLGSMPCIELVDTNGPMVRPAVQPESSATVWSLL